jgi:hypothetical protein
MTDRDPRTVFVAENAKLAQAVVDLLAQHDITAEVGPVAPVEVSPLTGINEAPEEFLVLVTDPKQIDDARLMLATAENQAAVRAVGEKRAARTGTLSATCEDCGKPSEWPAKSMGTTEVCPHCGHYMDIPDPDEDWSGMDFGAPEGDEEEEGAKG